ncbi:hypothetical protein Clacol_001012 [Clathrus columnatus]|uniref:Uncharacterized protein n=1 Tax=Clathrus columnatus TaxID=1419009 RepID=A0AAV5A2N1_9AGAM|nr:hypothetical protein Clacol_001012 [Clathrus columnatus]
MADITALISPKLEIFILDLRELQLSFFWYLCSTLITRVQTLRCLKLCLTSREEEANGCLDPFMQVLRSFRKTTLIHVWMPESFHTKETIDELGKFPNLFELGIGIPIKMMYNELWNRYPEIYKEEGKDFYALSNLSFTGPQHSLFDGFLNKGKFFSLTDITWTACMEIVDPEFFVTTIVEACPELYFLWVGV